MIEEQTSLYKAFAQGAQNFAHKEAILSQHENTFHPLTYNQLFQKTAQFSHYLTELGVKTNDNVIILLENQSEFAWVFFAIMSRAAVAVPLDVQYTATQVEQIALHSESKIIITKERFGLLIRDQLSDFKIVMVDSHNFAGDLESKPLANNFLEVAPNSIGVLFYTSGTTSHPKGVMLSHENLLANVSSINQLGIVNSKDIVVSVLPLHHAYAFTVTFLAPLFSGATIVYPANMSSQSLLTSMKETKATILVGVPQIFALMHRSIREKMKNISILKKIFVNIFGSTFFAIRQATGLNLSKGLFAQIHQNLGPYVRFMVSGGAKLDREITTDFTKWGFTILEGYGLTETSPVVTFNPPAKPKIGSVGKPLAGVEVKINGVNALGLGEVLIKGPNVMLGYYKLNLQTQEVIKDGWFY